MATATPHPLQKRAPSVCRSPHCVQNLTLGAVAATVAALRSSAFFASASSARRSASSPAILAASFALNEASASSAAARARLACVSVRSAAASSIPSTSDSGLEYLSGFSVSVDDNLSFGSLLYTSMLPPLVRCCSDCDELPDSRPLLAASAFAAAFAAARAFLDIFTPPGPPSASELR